MVPPRLASAGRGAPPDSREKPGTQSTTEGNPIMNSTAAGTQVFLGGSCDPTSWRREVAIPALERAGVSFYNPQVDDWSPELVGIEAAAKAAAQTCLFVIDSQTRAVASGYEALEVALTGHDAALVILDIEDGLVIDGEPPVTGRQLKDLNRGRVYLRDAATRNGIRVYDTVEAAIAALVARYAA